MKRSLEKAQPRLVRNRIPCNATLVKMGNSYSSPPEFWVTISKRCEACRVGFVVTAEEQQAWHEVYGIPYVVSINRCRTCRQKRRAQGRIVTRLAELMPLVKQKQASEDQMREAVLIIAEGTVRPDVRRSGVEDCVLSHEPVLIKGITLINRLLKAKRPQPDLLIIQRHFQERLGNVARVQRITQDIERLRQGPALGKAMSALESWLKTPTKRLWDRVIEPPRL